MPQVEVLENQLGQKEWDAFVETSNPWSFFQSFLWGEVQKQLGNDVVRLTLKNKETLVGIAQIMVVRAKRGTFLHLRHGPVFKDLSSTQLEAYWRVLLEHIKQQAKKSGAWFIRVSPMIEDSVENQQLLKSFGFYPAPIQAMDAETCWVLDLDLNEAELLANMRKTTRYLIRQGEKHGVEITHNDDIESFLDLYRETASRHHFVPHTGIGQEFEIFRKNNQALLLLGRFENQLLAGALILFFGHQAIYHHGASIPSKIPVACLLQWQAILEAKKRGATLYNFWGIAPENKPHHPWQGITLFKKGFGGREMKFLHAYDLPLSPSYAISYTIESARRKWRGY